MNIIERIPFNKLFIRNNLGYSPVRKIRNGSITHLPTQAKSEGHSIMLYKNGLIEDFTTADYLISKNDLGEDTIIGFVESTITKSFRRQ